MYNYGMTTVAELSASNAKNIVTENNKRGATIVRICGEEHSAISTAGIATTYLAHDNDMCFISDYKFKLIFGDGIGNDNPNAPVPTNVVWGSGTWHNINAFKAQYPLGSAIDVDGMFGCQSLVPWTCLRRADGRYIPVEEILAGESVLSGDGKMVNTVSDNDPTEEDLVEVKFVGGSIVGTLGHRMFVQGEAVKLRELKKGMVIDTPEVSRVEDLGLNSDQYKFLGFWLGDGDISFKGKMINGIRVTVGTKRKEEFLRSLGVDLFWHQHSNGKAKVATLASTVRNERLRETIVRFKDKRIPVLGEGSEEVLAGYIAADGTKKRLNQVVITGVNRALLCSIADMAWNLGYKATLRKPLVREKTNLCDHPKPISALSINFKPKRGLVRGEVISVNLAGRGTVYHTNVAEANHSYIAEGMSSHNCVDYANAFWIGQVNRQINCGSDNARGIWTQARAQNAGTEFDLITSWSDLQPGDWIVWGGGAFGHIAMAVTVPNGSEITIWNQNGSGYPWPSGGATLSSDTKSSNGFLGAFRYRGYASNPSA